jgi:hypothetical protein
MSLSLLSLTFAFLVELLAKFRSLELVRDEIGVLRALGAPAGALFAVALLFSFAICEFEEIMCIRSCLKAHFFVKIYFFLYIFFLNLTNLNTLTCV